MSVQPKEGAKFKAALPCVRGEYVVNGTDDLVHALDVALPGVELGVDEEDPLDDLPVRLVAVLQRGVVLGRLPLGQRQLVHPDADALDRLRLQPRLLHPHVQPVARVLGDLRVGRRRRLAEEGDVGAQAAHVLVDLQQHLCPSNSICINLPCFGISSFFAHLVVLEERLPEG